MVPSRHRPPHSICRPSPAPGSGRSGRACRRTGRPTAARAPPRAARPPRCRAVVAAPQSLWSLGSPPPARPGAAHARPSAGPASGSGAARRPGSDPGSAPPVRLAAPRPAPGPAPRARRAASPHRTRSAGSPAHARSTGRACRSGRARGAGLPPAPSGWRCARSTWSQPEVRGSPVASFIAGRHAVLDERLAAIDARARDGLLPDVTITKGVLKIAPIEKATPPEAEALAARLYAMLPRIRITDLLAEVARWTRFPDCFTHLRTGEVAADSRILMAGLLADGLNLGLTHMAEASSIASLGQLAWTSDWHIREETYALALRCLVNQQQREPFAAIFGSGTASSSDGQFFQAGGFGRNASRLNTHYGQSPGFKVYTHLSDRYGPFYTKLIAATASEALHVLDALLYHQSEVSSRRHHTDGGGDSNHVFALCSLLGFQFAPRIPDLKHRRLYSFAKPSAHPALEPMIAGRINVALIRAHWSEILRVVASVRTGTVTASLIMRQLASYPRQNGIAAALRELGRLERTLFTLDWIEDPALRRTTGRELNKGESRNSLARAVFIHRLGEIRDRTYENQQHRASGLNLLVTAIILWNPRYLERAVAALRQAEDVPDQLLIHLSPLGGEHVNLTGDYVWAAEQSLSENIGGLRPLRAFANPSLQAA